MRGSGKTTVGKALASLLDCPFMDLDHYLVEREKATVAEIVSKSGWPVFRRLEKECLADGCASLPEGGVIATGGGIVLDAENREFMRRNGRVIWLAADPDILAARLSDNPDPAQRPAFGQKSLLEEMRELAIQRFPHYSSAAHCIINAEGDADSICQLIHHLLKRGQI